jgi:O-antigen/teichoic acid export membrane protein
MVPTLLDVFALVVSIVTSVGWALYSPGAWALAAGPLFGGLAKAIVSHWWYRAERVRLGWNKDYARELFAYSRWIIGSTMVSFVAQQFHVLYLGKFLPLAVLGVYQLAWNFCSQASKPITALANRVIIPHFAELNRRSPAEHSALVRSSLHRFLPACLAACTASGLFAPALFGLFYDASYADAGPMGILFSIVVWFMILQHVPRSALLSLGESRGVAGMSLWNAVLTVIGIVAGYAFGGGSITGAILGNALGNVAGCAFGGLAMRRKDLDANGPMLSYSLGFFACLGAGVGLMQGLARAGWMSLPWASLLATVVLSAPLGLWVWRSLRPAPAG